MTVAVDMLMTVLLGMWKNYNLISLGFRACFVEKAEFGLNPEGREGYQLWEESILA